MKAIEQQMGDNLRGLLGGKLKGLMGKSDLSPTDWPGQEEKDKKGGE